MDTPIRLEIVKGVAPAPGDPHSAEAGLDTLNLIDPSGIALLTNGWRMQLPALKKGGIWADSDGADGRTLIGDANTNVKEKMRVVVSNTDLKQRQAIMRHLNRMKEDAEAFWTGGYQIEPVYLALQAASAQAEQFALIYTLEYDPSAETDPFETASPWEFTLEIEREPAWRMVVPPGVSPRWYHHWKNGRTPGMANFDYDDLRLDADATRTDHFAYDSLYNRFEWTGGGTDHSSYLAKNWIDIDGEDIPGDAPALVEVSINYGTVVYGLTNQILIGRSTLPRDCYSITLDETILAFNIFAAGDSNGLVTIANDACGVFSNDDAVNRKIATYTVAGSAPWTEIMDWRQTNDYMSPNMFKGTWAAFLRCQQITGALGDIEARLKIVLGPGGVAQYIAYQYLDPQTMPFINDFTSCAPQFPLTYLGQFEFPFSGEAYSGPAGRGLDGYGEALMVFAIEVMNNNASSRNIEILDLVLMPVHEAFTIATWENFPDYPYVNPTGSRSVYIDNTGYLSHGKPGIICCSDTVGGDPPYSGGFIPAEIRGAPLMLEPGKDNRLYFIFQHYYTGGPWESSIASEEYEVGINVVPRCYGIADVEPDS